MREYNNEEEFSYDYENNDIPQDEEVIPQRKIVIGKQLLVIIQLIISGIALLFMVIMKLISGDFCNGILSWYDKNYYDSVYTSDDGKNDLSIFGINNDQNSQENSDTNNTNSETENNSKNNKNDVSKPKENSKSESM